MGAGPATCGKGLVQLNLGIPPRARGKVAGEHSGFILKAD